MKLYSFCTTNFKRLRDRFESTVPRDVDVEIVNIDHLIIEKGALSGGRAISKWKPEFMVDKVGQHWGEVVVVADIDIQFFRPFSDDVIQLLEGKDILFQDRFRTADRIGPVNIGFIAMQCNGSVLAFWQEVSRVVTKHINDPPRKHRIENLWWDEGVVNKLLKTSYSKAVRWGTLPDRYWLANRRTGRNSHRIPADIVLHHAIRTGPDTIRSKMAQMNFVRDNIGRRVRRSKSAPGGLALYEGKG